MKRIVVLGAGESGVGAAVLAKKKGFDVFVSDKGIINEKYLSVLSNNDIRFEQGKHSEREILNADEVIKSPGIPDQIALIKNLRIEGIPVIDEIEFAFRFSKGRTICITGSNGKTTTTMLTGHILQKAGVDVMVAGNVGKSYAACIAENDHDWFVLEISSFQLDNLHNFKADIAILLNITPDHLDRYNNEFSNYANSKFRIINNQEAGDYFIYCADDPVIQTGIEQRNLIQNCYPFSIKRELTEGGYLKNDKILININKKQFIMHIHQLALQGKHNIYNSLASGMATRILDIRKDFVKESLTDFKSVEHRLEYVTNVHGIEFINDSKATNVNSAWFALESMTKPVIWIVGGKDKGNDYSSLIPLVKQKVKAIICMGNDNKKIHKVFGESVEVIVDVNSASEAVRSSYLLGKLGDVVLLSPACASFDMFNNYEDRGHQFKEAVREL